MKGYFRGTSNAFSIIFTDGVHVAYSPVLRCG